MLVMLSKMLPNKLGTGVAMMVAGGNNGPDLITIRVKDQTGERTMFRIRRTMRICQHCTVPMHIGRELKGMPAFSFVS